MRMCYAVNSNWSMLTLWREPSYIPLGFWSVFAEPSANQSLARAFVMSSTTTHLQKTGEKSVALLLASMHACVLMCRTGLTTYSALPTECNTCINMLYVVHVTKAAAAFRGADAPCYPASRRRRRRRPCPGPAQSTHTNKHTRTCAAMRCDDGDAIPLRLVVHTSRFPQLRAISNGRLHTLRTHASVATTVARRCRRCRRRDAKQLQFNCNATHTEHIMLFTALTHEHTYSYDCRLRRAC